MREASGYKNSHESREHTFAQTGRQPFRTTESVTGVLGNRDNDNFRSAAPAYLCATDRRNGRSLTSVGFIVEWHVDLPNSFHHFVFDNVSWFSEEGEVFWPSFQ